MRKLFCLLALLEMAAHAATPNCLVRFAAVPEAETNYAIIETTYGQLLDKLGTNLGEGTRQTMAEGDPLAIPPGAEGDHLALERALKTFVEMLERKGWNTPDVRTRLAQTLVKRVAETKHAETQVRQKLVETESDYEFRLAGSGYRISPDERWLVNSDQRTEGMRADAPWTLHVLDLQSKQVHTYPTKGFVGPPFFSGDGSTLLFPQEDGSIAVVPFSNGAPQWDKRDIIPKHASGELMSDLTTTPDPNILYAEGSRLPYRIDLVTKTILAVQAPILTPDEYLTNSGGWRVLPGTGNVAMEVRGGRNRDQLRWVVAEYTGNAAVPFRNLRQAHKAVTANSPLYERPITFHADGEFDLFARTGKIFRKTGATDVPFFDPAPLLPTPDWRVKWETTRFRPGHPDQLIVGMHDAGGNIFRQRVWDTKRNREVFSYDARFPRFSDRGNVLVMLRDSDLSTLQICNVKRLEAEQAP